MTDFYTVVTAASNARHLDLRMKVNKIAENGEVFVNTFENDE